MTTPEQAALLAKHRAFRYGDLPGRCEICEDENDDAQLMPCDVHRMAELKDAEIAEHVLRADSLRAEVRRLEEEIDDLREQIAMDDFAKNTTPGGTWIERNEDA